MGWSHHAYVLYLLSCVWPCDPWTVACWASLSLGSSRQEYWGRWPFPPPGDLPNLGLKPLVSRVSCITGRLFTTEPPEALVPPWDNSKPILQHFQCYYFVSKAKAQNRFSRLLLPSPTLLPLHPGVAREALEFTQIFAAYKDLHRQCLCGSYPLAHRMELR